MTPPPLVVSAFRRTVSRAVRVAIVTCAALVTIASTAHAGQCGLESLNGSYGMKFDGVSQNLGRFGSISLWTFDGKGGLNAAESFNSEATGPATRTITGSYEIDSSCVFRLLFASVLGHPHDVVGDCVLVDNGREFYCIDVEEGWVATGVGKQITGKSTPTRQPSE